MHFFRLSPMVHILSLIVLMVAAMPFVGSDASVPREEQAQAITMDVRDCDAHLLSGDMTLGCPGMMVHCVAFSDADHALSELKSIIGHVYYGSRAVDAESLKPEASSPPPRA